MRSTRLFFVLFFSFTYLSWGSVAEEGFFYQGDRLKPVHHAGAILLKQYPQNAPDGVGRQLCLISAYDKNLAHWTLPAGGVDASLDFTMCGDKKKYAPLMTVRREVLEETAGALYFRDSYLEQCPKIYSSKFKDLLVVAKDDTLSCSALSQITRRAASNVDLTSCWRETNGVNVIPISEVLTVAKIMKDHFVAGGHIKNLPSSIVSPNVSKHFKNPLVYLNTRLGQKVEFCAYYMGAIADALDDLSQILTQNDQGAVFNERHDQIFQENDKPKPEIRFDPAMYLALNQDVLAYAAKDNPLLSDFLERAARHYEGTGKNEGRLCRFSMLKEPLKRDVTENINPLIYMALNPDLQKHFGNQRLDQALRNAESHCKNNALNEMRPLYVAHSDEHEVGAQEIRATPVPGNFDIELFWIHNMYLKSYAQKKGCDPVSYTTMYLRTRGKEVDLPVFSASSYLLLNPALEPLVVGMPQEEAQRTLRSHYINGGHFGHKFYDLPQGFNPALYLAANPDVASYVGEKGLSLEVSLARAALHYATQGKNEKRLISSGGIGVRKANIDMTGMPEEFDPLVYLALNNDLRVAFKNMSWQNALEACRSHFVTNGKKEQRSY